MSQVPVGLPLRQRWFRARAIRAFHEAVPLGLEVLRLAPDDVGVRRSLARLLVELDRLEDAAEHWPVLRDLDPQDLESPFHIAKTMVAQGMNIDHAVSAAPASSATAGLRRNLRAVLEQTEEIGTQGARHIAICGVSFCGSTLTDRLLAGLPGVASVGESHWLTKARTSRGYEPANYALDEAPDLIPCSVCGRNCQVLSRDFRRQLAADHTGWYTRIAHRLGARKLISADKNPPKLLDNDPLLRFDALVLFKSPAQAWKSHLDKLPQDRDADFYLAECHKYLAVWTRSYETLLDHFSPQGNKIYLCFDSFVNQPLSHLAAVCSMLDLPFDDSVLRVTAPGHAIGGNRGAMAKLRQNGYAVEIMALPQPDFPADHWRALEEHEGVQKVFQRLMAACGPVESDA